MSTWIKLMDSFPRHPSMLGRSDSAFRSYIQALCYASEYRTDGWIPVEASALVFRRQKDIAELVDAGRLVERSDGWLIVNYLEHQRSRAQIDAERESARKRKAKQRGHGVTPDNVTPMSRGSHA